MASFYSRHVAAHYALKTFASCIIPTVHTEIRAVELWCEQSCSQPPFRRIPRSAVQCFDEVEILPVRRAADHQKSLATRDEPMCNSRSCVADLFPAPHGIVQAVETAIRQADI